MVLQGVWERCCKVELEVGVGTRKYFQLFMSFQYLLETSIVTHVTCRLYLTFVLTFHNGTHYSGWQHSKITAL